MVELIIILIGKWIVHFNYADKNLKIKAENAVGVVPPTRLSNADICIFGNNYLDKSVSDKYGLSLKDEAMSHPFGLIDIYCGLHY